MMFSKVFTLGVELSAGKSPQPGVVDAGRIELVERIAGSATFGRSPRIRELLLYLCHSALDNPQAGISEHQIGIAVFGRKAGYDSNSETIVRVQASQLRKKLQQYFTSEGIDEPVLIELPKGSYTPVFRPRQESEPVKEAPEPQPRQQNAATIAAGILVVLLAVVSLWLGYRNSVLRESALPLVDTPGLDHFYRDVFHQGQQVQVVVSDANLMMLSDVVGRLVTLAEYRDRTYPRAILDSIPDPKIRAQTDHENGTFLIPMQDATVLRGLTAVGLRYRLPTAIISARDFRMLPQTSGNLVLLGHKKSNPWMELFEDRMNFRYMLSKELKGTISNRSPLPGEQAVYGSEWVRSGHCVVAYLPKPTGEGAAVLVFGTDMSSLLTGGSVLTDEKYMANLLGRMHVRPGDRIPYFEVLLRTKIVANVAPSFEFITHRLIAP
jgi:hypothetical protein